MKKSKKSSEEAQDRLSELPNSILFQIFWLMPMRDVVRTTVLSKRWENLWTTTPYLNFYGHATEFVTRALILWKGIKILKFKYSHGCILKKSVSSDIDVWVRLAMENGVEELYLRDIYLCDSGPPLMYCVPQNLNSCWSLKVLSLRGCKLHIHGNVQWNKLRSLALEECDLDAHFIYQVVSGSPKLEVLILNFSDKYENLSIRSSSLKRLLIKKRSRYMGEEPSANLELRIWSPNLETLDFGGVPYGKYSLENVSSVTHLTLDFSYQICGDDFLGDVLGQIFRALQHVEKLVLSDWCIKVLGAMEDKHWISPLSSNLKFLTINKNFEGNYEQVVDFLETFPELKALVLRSGHYYLIPADINASSFFNVERNLPESFLLQLKTVDISWADGDKLIFPLVKIMLKHASKLEKMVIRVKLVRPSTGIPSISFCLALQKLLRMPRSSPSAELILADF